MTRSMIRILPVLLLFVIRAFGADRYVTTSGTNSGSASSWGTAWRTLAYAESNATSGDTINVGEGDFREYVQIQGVDRLTWRGWSNATSCAFRFSSASNRLENFILSGAQNEGALTWNAAVRIEPGGHSTVISNVTFRDSPWMKASNLVFNATTDTITWPGGDFVSAGFRVGGQFYWGAVSITNYTFANHNGTGRPTAVTTDTLTFADGVLIAETNSSAWSLIQAGPTHEGIYGIYCVPSGGAGPTNCVFQNNLFTNLVTIPLYAVGENHLVVSNEVVNCIGNPGLVVQGSNHRILRNYFHDSWLPVRFSQAEGSLLVHAGGGTWYDYIAAYVSPKSYSITWNTNNLFAFNWFENIEQPIASPGYSAAAGFFGDWRFRSNVWLRTAASMSSGCNGMEITGNTFYKCSIRQGEQYVLTIGSSGITNVTVRDNLFINCGPNESSNEGHYSLVNAYGTVVTNFNMVAGSEVEGWPSPAGFTEPNGVKGGNPLFFDEGRPRGADGIPFTADDGLRLLPTSPGAGKGAHPLATGLMPVFSVSATQRGFGWFEPTGTNYNPAWLSALPYNRATPYREYELPDPLPNAPQLVTFTATNSISGTWSTNDWVGIRDFVWDFGDGSLPHWTRWPDISHTFLRTGAVTMTLTVTNSAGSTATTTRKYLVLDKDPAIFTNSLRYVSTSGNDTNAGTQGSPWRTVTNATKRVSVGDYVAVLPGNYTNWIDTSNGGIDGTYSNRVTFVGYGARIPGMYQKESWWTWEGFEVVPVGIPALAGIDVVPVNHGITLRNLLIRDGDADLAAIRFTSSGGVGGTNHQILNCNILRMDGGPYGVVKVTGNTNVWIDSMIQDNCYGQADTVQVEADTFLFSRGWVNNLGWTNNNHTDGVSVGANTPITAMRNIVFERSWWNAPSGEIIQVANMGSGTNNSIAHSNVVFRNCVFIGFANGMNPLRLDGPKLHNNLFVRCAWTNEYVIVSGSSSGSSFHSDYRNNIFFKCGRDDGLSTGKGWYQNGLHASQIGWFSFDYADYNFVTGAGYASKDTGGADSAFKWAITGQEVHGINGGNPLFSDESGQDFRLQSGSPLLGSGANLSAFFSNDYFGKPRTVWSIGPFGSASGGSGGSTPTGVRANVLLLRIRN